MVFHCEEAREGLEYLQSMSEYLNSQGSPVFQVMDNNDHGDINCTSSHWQLPNFYPAE